jgi:hypothetical protein
MVAILEAFGRGILGGEPTLSVDIPKVASLDLDVAAGDLALNPGLKIDEFGPVSVAVDPLSGDIKTSVGTGKGGPTITVVDGDLESVEVSFCAKIFAFAYKPIKALIEFQRQVTDGEAAQRFNEAVDMVEGNGDYSVDVKEPRERQ